MKRIISILLISVLFSAMTVNADPAAETATKTATETIPFWNEDSPALASVLSYVDAVTDSQSEEYVPPQQRIAVFDMDGTLYGELFPTYFDECLMLHRLLHDDTYQAPEDDKAYALALETALLNGEPEPDSDKSNAQLSAAAFRGFTMEEYQAYIRDFMSSEAVGFDNMTYAEGFYKPMIALVQFLAENDFTIFISSGSERTLARELTSDVLGEWIPRYRIIGSTYTLEASGQGDTEGRKYTYTPEDQVILEGNLAMKNQKMNKVVNIVDEIGMTPVLVFGNSSGDFSMAQYALQNGGKAYMLLCDDTERDYGNLEKADSFKKDCMELGFETVSMRDEFETIYGPDVVKTKLSLDEAA